MSPETSIILNHAKLALAHYRKEHPDLTPKALVASVANSVQTQLLADGTVSDDDVIDAESDALLIARALAKL